MHTTHKLTMTIHGLFQMPGQPPNSDRRTDSGLVQPRRGAILATRYTCIVRPPKHGSEPERRQPRAEALVCSCSCSLCATPGSNVQETKHLGLFIVTSAVPQLLTPQIGLLSQCTAHHICRTGLGWVAAPCISLPPGLQPSLQFAGREEHSSTQPRDRLLHTYISPHFPAPPARSHVAPHMLGFARSNPP